MKKLIKNLIYWIKKIFTGRGAVILMYHSIDNNKEFFTVSPVEFERQMNYLKNNNFKVISLRELVNAIQNNKKILRKTVVITFDDGYLDNYEKAFPILKKYNFHATIFINTATIGTTTTGRHGTRLPILSKEQIKHLLEQNLIDFESHSHSHAKLSSLDISKAEAEIAISKDLLQEILGSKVTLFAYPYGDFNQQTVELTKKYFQAACLIKKGRTGSKNNLFMLNRNSIDSAVSFGEFKNIIEVGKI